VSVALDVLSWLALGAGAVFVVGGGIGLVRLPDFYTRLHAAGLVDTLGAFLIVVGLALQAGLTQVTIKLVLILVFLFFTSPTATHAVAHAAVAGGLKPWSRSTDRKDDD
jgi:multicomponent Na+:H+ antiporter subunit G